MAKPHLPAAEVAVLAALLLGAGTGWCADAPRDVFPQPPFAQGHLLHVPGIAFQPVDPVAVRLAPRGAGLVCPAGGAFSYLDAWFALPHAARLQSVQIHGRDNSSQQDQSLFLFRVCHGQVGAPPAAAATTLLGVASTSGINQGFMAGINVPGTEIADAAHCRYLLRVRLTAEGATCLGDDMILDRALVAYQVLP